MAIFKFPIGFLGLLIWSIAYCFIIFFKLWLCMFFVIIGQYYRLFGLGNIQTINRQYTKTVRSFQKSMKNYWRDVNDIKNWVFTRKHSL